MRIVTISIAEHVIHAELFETPTADSIFKHLPFESIAQTWGDEVYFATPLSGIALEDNAKDIVQLGELAFWVEGSCIAIGFGPTPISRHNEIRLAAKTNIWATTNYDLTKLRNIKPGDKIILHAAQAK